GLPAAPLRRPPPVPCGRPDQPTPSPTPRLAPRHFRRPVRSTLSHPPRAKPKYRNPHTVLERHRSHLHLLRFGAAITPSRVRLSGTLSRDLQPSNRAKNAPIRC